ncbi:MAG: hypothetical protein ACI31R_00920 [Bacilli bacterium]
MSKTKKTDNIKNFLKEKNISKKKIIGCLIGVALLSILIFVITNYNNFAVKNVVNNYFDYLTTQQLEESQKYLDRKYNYEDNDTLNLENFKSYVSKWEVDINSIKIKKDTAIVELNIYSPSMLEMLQGYTSYLFSGEKSKDEYYKEQLNSTDLKYENHIGVIVLEKNNGKWKIKTDDNFKNVMLYGANNVSLDTEDVSNNTSTSNGASLNEEEIYITKYLNLKSYKIQKYTKYDYSKVPGIGDIEIKNTGNKNVSKLTITAYFQDETGRDIAEEDFLIIGGWDYNGVLKANYSWKMEKDTFYEFENLTNDVNLSKNKVKITEIEFDE